MDDDALLARCREVASAVGDRLATVGDWGLVPGSRAQHHTDVAADSVAVEMLVDAGLAVLSEESGLTGVGPGSLPGSGFVAVLDPLDGSTNAHQGIPWYATSICVVDSAGPRVALVRNQASGVGFEAVRGRGAWTSDGTPLRPSGRAELGDAIVGLSGMPTGPGGWRQFRALGAAALDLCAVAAGVLDGFADCTVDAHGVWDYAAGVLICREAGAAVEDVAGRELIVVDHAARRTPVAAATPELLVALRSAAWGGR